MLFYVSKGAVIKAHITHLFLYYSPISLYGYVCICPNAYIHATVTMNGFVSSLFLFTYRENRYKKKGIEN